MGVPLNNFVLLFLVGCCTYYKLPPSFTKCDRKQSDFSECLTTAVENALKQLNEPIPELGLFLEPLEIPFVYAPPGEKTVNFHQYYKSLKLWGFSNAECSRVDMNFEKKKLTMECFTPEVVVWADYHYEGKLFNLAINASGPLTVNLRNLKIHQSFLLEEYLNNGLKYFIVTGYKFIIEPESITTHLGNLFRGDPVRSLKLNQVFNENALELFRDVKHNYEPLIGNQFAIIFNNLLARVPVFELFGDE